MVYFSSSDSHLIPIFSKMKKLTKRKLFKIIWFSLVTIFCIWQWFTYQARGLPENIFENSETVEVRLESNFISFIAKNSSEKKEVIFLQGGLVDPEAYAPLCRKIAAAGITCHLVKMNWRMPVWYYQEIGELFDLKDGNFILGGHSQGAKMSAQYVYENPQLLKGLFLLGSSHPRDIDLSNTTIPTIKIYGELDGLASVPEVLENKDKLPKDAVLKMIEGANHSQFAYIGSLLTDETPAITLEQQQKATTEILISFLQSIE